MVAESLSSSGGEPMLYLLGQESVKKMGDMAVSSNAKLTHAKLLICTNTPVIV